MAETKDINMPDVLCFPVGHGPIPSSVHIPGWWEIKTTLFGVV